MAAVAPAPVTTTHVPSHGPTAPAYHYNVKMTCSGCSGAVDRVLKKNVEAPNGYSVSLEKQQVLVWGPTVPPFEVITDKIAKTGKAILSKEVIESSEKLQALQA